MSDLSERIVAHTRKRSYEPLKPKELARKLGVTSGQYPEFRRLLKELVRDGRLVMGKNHTIRGTAPHGSVTGTFRRSQLGTGFVRPVPVDGKVGPDIRIPEDETLDAATGDTVLVTVLRRPNRPDMLPQGTITKVVERANRQFVGTYFERDGQGYVRVDGTVFHHSIAVGDPGAKGVRPDDKVVFEMVRFPSPEDRGEGVVTEILGPKGKPGVDTLGVIKAFGLPEAFPEDALEEARHAASVFREDDLEGRKDFTADLVITIDPADARDFDDAISLTQDDKTGHWTLSVHIADVGHFAPQGGPLDREARKRATSIYLPQLVIPMFPELISNHLASLQPDKVRFVKTAVMTFTPDGKKTGATFYEGAIKSKKRFAYEQVMKLLDEGNPAGEGRVDDETFALLQRMKTLALILRNRRKRRGSLELQMPEVKLDYDRDGKVTGGTFAVNDLSHQIIEEFMLAANEAVAERLDATGAPFLRRVHPAPDPFRLAAFADFARSLGYKMPTDSDRFALQRILEASADKAETYAVHYALLRSLKQAVYAPGDDGHYALASDDYCHFTSPIRRYPDLTIHRQLSNLLRTGKPGGSFKELVTLGDHCSKMERRAELAERELVKVRLLTYLEDKLGLELDAVITGVADYGFFAQGETLPVEGMVHVSTLSEDYFYYEESEHSLVGRRSGVRYRLGDKIRVAVVRVDVARRQLDLRVVAAAKEKKRK